MHPLPPRPKQLPQRAARPERLHLARARRDDRWERRVARARGQARGRRRRDGRDRAAGAGATDALALALAWGERKARRAPDL